MSGSERLGHWELVRDASDSTDGHRAGTVSGSVGFGEDGARFDGDGRISVAMPSGRSGLEGDLTLAAMVRLDDPVRASIGDLIGRFDARDRRGLSLGFAHGTAIGNQRNDRNLVFGIDGGTEPVWTNRGRPGRALYAPALAVHMGSLYVGTYEGDPGATGHVYRFDGERGWVDTHAPVESNCVASLVAAGDVLFAGTTRMMGAGSGLPDSPNQHPGGEILRYEEATGWTSCGRIGDADSVVAMAAFGGDVFATPAHTEGVYRYAGGSSWEYVGTPGRRLIALGVHRGALYGAGNDHASVDEAMAKTRAGLVVPPRSESGGGGMFRWEGGTSWRSVGMQPDTTQVYSVAVHQGDMWIGTWPNGLAFRYAGDERWDRRGRLGDETEVMGMVDYNGKLYGGTVPHAQVYRLDEPGTWVLTGRLDHTPDVLYRRAASMAIHQGRLFCGTLPSGAVWSLETGVVVSHDSYLGSGWHHVAATREDGRLALYVDGRCVAQTDGRPGLDIGNEEPLTIGGGPQGGFTGWMRDVQVFRGALAPVEIDQLVGASRTRVLR
jgi:hypothetical protein